MGTAGIVLCGGKSSRMGRAKAWLPWCGRPLVAHVVIDGSIDTPFIREAFGEALAQRGPDAMLAPDDIAETYWAIHSQPRSAWSFEADQRPWLEPW